MQTVLLFICAYLLGSIPTGKLLGFIKKIDIQKHGSGGIGFANAVRVLGWRMGVIVLVVDVLKGFVPLFVAKQYYQVDPTLLLLIGLMPILGHAFPVWLRFVGGKSIATGLGVLLVIEPRLALLGVLLYCVAFALFRRSDVGSLAGVWSLPIGALVIRPEITAYVLLLAFFASYTHRQNIRKFIKAYDS